MSGPLVSVLTPSFNQARWLGDNLRSVASQTWANIEHIVMDGGSTDGSAEVLDAAIPPVHWRSAPDDGQADALNKAFAESKGEIIGWLNSDDAYWDKRVVANVVAFLDAHPDVDVVYGHAAYVDEDGLVLHFFRAPPYGSGRLLRRYDYVVQPAVFIRRRALGDRLVDGSFHFALDYELWLRLAGEGARFARVDRVLAVDRAQAERKSRVLLDVLAADMGRLTETYGLPHSPWSRLITASHAVYSRFAGARLIWKVPEDLAFTARVDSKGATLVRQCFTRRRDMPVGGE